MKRWVLPALLLVACAATADDQPTEGKLRAVAAANLFRAQSWLPPPPPPSPPPPPQAPPLPFTYQGQLQEGKGLAVFLGRQQQTLIVRLGDTIDDNYRVDALTPTLATFTYLPLGATQQLTLRNAP